ncbi:Piwi-domain-containing protein [Gigaspora margarita]|uniref:Piwi-domain-containing protein n=1 Tax=Gigaspora margarita TaxID=4874 RepID=A0A8H4AXS5_GIGMA|nr:Piwi-domain-containing protein [Gigaspora margarita]
MKFFILSFIFAIAVFNNLTLAQSPAELRRILISGTSSSLKARQYSCQNGSYKCSDGGCCSIGEQCTANFTCSGTCTSTSVMCNAETCCKQGSYCCPIKGCCLLGYTCGSNLNCIPN